MTGLSFAAYVRRDGRVAPDLELPDDGSVIAVRAAVLAQLAGPASLGAFELFLRLGPLAERWSLETGAPRLAAVRAAPLTGVDRRSLAGVLGGALR